MLIKKEVKKLIISGIQLEELVLLKFTHEEKQTQLKWKHSKEFEYNGEMYDIVKSFVVEDTNFYWVWWDNDETKINKQIENLTINQFGNHPKNIENQKRLLVFFQTLYYNAAYKLRFNDYSEPLSLSSIYSSYYKSIFITPPSPPPKLS